MLHASYAICYTRDFMNATHLFYVIRVYLSIQQIYQVEAFLKIQHLQEISMIRVPSQNYYNIGYHQGRQEHYVCYKC